MTFSPPAWGWSVPGAPCAGCLCVFPTRVGMVRTSTSEASVSCRFPHPRGDGPVNVAPQWRSRWFSPPAWGWSNGCGERKTREPVFPTRVGMVRSAVADAEHRQGFPHPRGDGPPWTVTTCPTSLFSHPRGDGPRTSGVEPGWQVFSPPAWGWSALPVRSAEP